jgi:DNA helicase IV
MTNEEKQSILSNSKSHVEYSISQIFNRISELKRRIEYLDTKLRTPNIYSTESADKSEKEVDLIKRDEFYNEIDNNNVLLKSPYFSKLEINFEDNKISEDIYFGLFSYPDIKLYSWVSPIATLRFKSIGSNSYKLPDGSYRGVEINKKSLYQIIDREIHYLSYEDKNHDKSLIYQTNITSTSSKQFLLKQIVETMEEYQDQIIRIPYRGSMLISGPAGSGKTTLALHRVAYLLQSPDTKDIFPNHKILILLQDESTKNYFGQLLPSLGIRDIKVDTYFSFARKVLKLDDKWQFVIKYGDKNVDGDILEYRKYEILQSYDIQHLKSDPILILKKVYKEYLDSHLYNCVLDHLRKNILDRADINLMIKLCVDNYDQSLSSIQRLKSKKLMLPRYNLIVIDEAENYTKEEIWNIKRTLNPLTKSIIYIGDLVQQTRMWTIKHWDDINEHFEQNRKILLHKNYRNTKQIVRYIQSKGYNTDYDYNLLESGNDVLEISVNNRTLLFNIINEQLKTIEHKQSIGILVLDDQQIQYLQNNINLTDNIKLLSVYEAQGVEFDTVIFINSQDFQQINYNNIALMTELITKEKQSVLHDLRYVAMTRAVKNLIVIEI